MHIFPCLPVRHTLGAALVGACLGCLIASTSVPAQAQAPAVGAGQAAQAAQRTRLNFDQGWKFAFGHAYDPARDFDYGTRPFFFAKAGYGDGPASVSFSDAGWRQLDLPHDWAVELPFDARASAGHGSKAIGRNFPDNSVGWYRKVFDIPAAAKGRRIALEFDGVYRNSVVWVNGHYLGTEPSGYSGFRYDITDYLEYGGPNVIAVRADATMEEGWFYEGAGIYRHVWLTSTAPLHVAQWGTYVRSTLQGRAAEVDVDVTVRNDGKAGERFAIEHEIVAADGRVVARAQAPGLAIAAAASADYGQRLRVEAPHLWSLDDPYLYRLRTRVRQAGQLVDQYDTPFGIRTVAFDPDKGFFLNGKPVKLQGTNNHQDHAGVGVALPDGLQEWRLKQLKAIGVNAYRASHHPPTPELLEAADRLGILVIDEHRMMGTTPEIVGQLERMVRRDRNHPSVILWSVGNEEWALEWNALGTHLAREMSDIVQRLDPTRRTTLAASGSGKGVSVGADVIGFNYGAQHDVDAFHRDHPAMPAVMTEEGSTLSTRGVYVDAPAKSQLNAYDRQGRPGASLSIEEGWRRVQERPWMAGMFIWTGFDYRGETTPFGWPATSSQFGMLDTTGVPKDTAYYLKAWWTKVPTVHILPHWNWPGREGQAIDVRVYANGDAVELFQDGRSLGRQAMPRDGHLQWKVRYRPGSLVAKAYRAGKLVATDTVATTGASEALRLTADTDRLKSNGSPNGSPYGTDIAVVWVNVQDRRKTIVPTAGELVDFETTGPLRIIGVGNGDPGSHEADHPVDRHAFLPLGGWRTLGLSSREAGTALDDAADLSSWRDPQRWLPPEQEPARTPYVVLRGTFPRPQVAPGQLAVLFIDQLDPEQRVYVNGKAVVPSTIDGSLAIALDGLALKDENSLAYVAATPPDGVPGMAERSASGRKWGSVRVTTKAGPWQRTVFNGWAQVIVQATGQSGPATLTARSKGLAPATLTWDIR